MIGSISAEYATKSLGRNETYRLKRFKREAKKITHRTLLQRTKADFREMIRAEAGARAKEHLLGMVGCVTCSRGPFPWRGSNLVDAGHFLAGGRNSHYFEESNCHPQCSHCNRSGGMPQEYEAFMLETYGQEEIDRLRKLKDTVSRTFSVDELCEMRTEYRGRIDRAISIMAGKPQEDTVGHLAIQEFNFAEKYSDANMDRIIELTRAAKTLLLEELQLAPVLVTLKKKLSKGDYGPYLEQVIGIELTQARRIVKAHAVFENVSDEVKLEIGKSKMFLLSHDDFPEAARAKIIADFERGNGYTVAQIEEVKKGYLLEAEKVEEKEAETPAEPEPVAPPTSDDDDEWEDFFSEESKVDDDIDAAMDAVDNLPKENPLNPEVQFRDFWNRQSELSQKSILIYGEEQGLWQQVSDYPVELVPRDQIVDAPKAGYDKPKKPAKKAPKKATPKKPAPKKKATPKKAAAKKKATPKKKASPKANGKFDPLKVELPIQTEDFADAWEMWVEDRRERNKKLTKRAVELQLIKLDGMGERRAIAAINHTIENGWTGLREPEGSNGEGIAGAAEAFANGE